jgi:hypothetical protein
VALALAGRGWGLAYADGVVAHHHPSSQRDSVRRGVIERRNELWTAWSRLPASAAVKASWHLVRHGWRDRSVRRGTLHALRGLPGSLADRRAVPPAIAREWQLLTARSDADD